MRSTRPMGKNNREWHKLRSFPARVAKHHALIPGAAGVHPPGRYPATAHGCIGTSVSDAKNYRFRSCIPNHGPPAVQYLRTEVFWDTSLRPQAQYDWSSPRSLRHPRFWINRQSCVHNRVGNLIADFIRMSGSHRFGRKKRNHISSFFRKNKKLTRR